MKSKPVNSGVIVGGHSSTFNFCLSENLVRDAEIFVEKCDIFKTPLLGNLGAKLKL